MILFVIILAVLLLIYLIVECVSMFEIGTPISDADLSDYLNKIATESTRIEVYRKWNDKFRLDFKMTKSYVPGIHQTQYSLMFPYFIEDVGVVPIWSPSYKKIKEMFSKEIGKSRYTTNKRAKLGL